MTTKRMVILVALLMLVLSSLACGGGGDGDAPEATDTPAPVEVELVPLLEAVGDALDNDCPSQAYCTTNEVNCKLGLASCSPDGQAACEECKTE